MDDGFYGVKTIFEIIAEGKPKTKDKYYKKENVLIEERILLFKAKSHQEAIQNAEKEAMKYVEQDAENIYGQKIKIFYKGICDAFELYDVPGNNIEVFSSTRILTKKLTKRQLADLMIGKHESKEDLKFRKKFRSK